MQYFFCIECIRQIVSQHYSNVVPIVDRILKNELKTLLNGPSLLFFFQLVMSSNNNRVNLCVCVFFHMYLYNTVTTKQTEM